MAKEAKFNFIAENQLNNDTKSGFTVTVTVSGQLYFSKDVIMIYDLEDKFLKLFADVSKKAIGWKVFKKGEVGDLKKLRQISIYRDGQGEIIKGTIMITKILNLLDKDWKKKKLRGLEIKEYKSPLFEGKMHYIELKGENR